LICLSSENSHSGAKPLFWGKKARPENPCSRGISPANEAMDAHAATVARMPLAIEVAADATGTALVIPGVGLFTYYDARQAAAYGIADRNES
jgi:hypothetical protein